MGSRSRNEFQHYLSVLIWDNKRMGIQMSIPFSVLENGSVSVVSDPNIQLQQRVDALISTELGSRAMRANMGLELNKLLFQPASGIIAAELSNKVQEQLSLYEPGVEAVSVTPDISQSTGGAASVNVTYRPIYSAAPSRAITDLVTIKVGGTVVEVKVNGTS